MWSGHSLFHLFSYQKIGQEFFNRDILDREDSSLGELGGLRNQILMVLGIATLTTFVFIVAGTKSVGKVCMVAVPAAFMLMMTLTIRACLATGGPQGVLLLLAPDWSVLTLPGAWLEAAAQVVFSLQLGLGALTTFASYNKYEHNLVRDTAIMAVAHLVWLLLALLLTYALLGLAQNAEVLQLPVEVNKEATGALLLSNTGTGIWLAAVTLDKLICLIFMNFRGEIDLPDFHDFSGEKAFSTLSYGWLWAGLYFILVIIVGVTSLFGYIEVITSTLVSIKPSYSRFKPLIAFFVLAVLFLLDLVLATQGGIHIYHLLSTYIASWPTLLFSLLTVTATLGCHGAGFLMRDLSDMSKFRLSHWVQAHLSVIFYSLLPIALTATLVWHLVGLSTNHLEEPLAAFGMALPSGWGLPLAWALSALPLTPLLLGAVLQLAWIRRGVPFTMHLKRLVKPTDRYYRNEHLESAGSGPNAQNTSTRA
jgi:SNF family Na+-dependent transporter